MTKAEIKALEKYPIVDGKVWTSAFGKFEFDRNYSERKAYQQGYEDAEKDIYKEMEDRMTEIREKQTKAALEDLNYTIKIDPPLGFDEGSAVVYHGKELISVLTWEDIRIITKILEELIKEEIPIELYNGDAISCYKEVLRRFKKTKQ